MSESHTHTHTADLDAAEQAAARGDLRAAEAHLREALRAQERASGPAHPDLASTCNNLAVVCEQNGKLLDAEHYFRRGYAVASSLFDDGHPLVVTSRANLKAFCDARGLLLGDRPEIGSAPPRAPANEPLAHSPVSSPAPGVPGAPARGGTAAAPAARRAPERPASPAGMASKSSGRAASSPALPRAVAWTLTIVALLTTAVVAWLWLAGGVQPQVQQTAVTEAATPPAADAGAAPSRSSEPRELTPAASAKAQAPASPAQESATASAPAAPPPLTLPPEPKLADDAASAGATARVVNASVCERLDTSAGRWDCTVIEGVTTARSATYLTRVAAARSVRVEHRWFEGERLRATRRLSVAASPGDGYRTFSRQSITPGQWRVELHAENGALLHEASFEVR